MRLLMPTNRGVSIRLPRRDLTESISLWLASRFVVFAIVFVAQISALNRDSLLADFVDLWAFQEFDWYASIAESGYPGDGVFEANVAYFPGTSLLMRLGIALGTSPPLAGLLVALFAGVLAAVAIAVLAGRFDAQAKWSVLALALAPVSIFLSAPWSEAPFFVFAVWAWVAAVRSKWVWAGVLAAAATFVRVNGLFLMVALVVLLLTQDRQRWRQGWALLLPAAVVAGHFSYLYSVTGSWTAWRDSMSTNFGRSFVDPVTSFLNTYNLIFDYIPGTVSSRFVIEIITAGVMILFTAVLLIWRYWGEATYVGLTVLSLITADLYQALPRSLLVLFPVWLVLARWMTERRFVQVAYVTLAIPLLGITTYLFSFQQWIS